MTEQRPGKPNGLERRYFRISPKTPHAVLLDPSSVLGSLYTRLAGDIVTNARELASDVDWEKVLSARYTYWLKGKCTYEGKSAVEVSIARNLRPVAEQMGWSMDSAEVVYMSGLYFGRVLDRSIRIQAQRVKKAENRKFVSDGHRAKKITKEEQEIAELSVFKEKIEIALAKFARQKLPRNKNYLENLQKLFGLLWIGKTEEADAMLVALSVGKALAGPGLLALPEPQVQPQPQAP